MAEDQRARQQALTRERLLDAAIEVFSAKGFAGASIDAIAQAAGYTKGAVYANFANKEELFLAVVDRRVKAVMRFPGEAENAPTAESARDFLQEAFNVEWALLALEAVLYAARHSPALREGFAERYRAVDAEARAVLDPQGDMPAEVSEDLAIARSALTEGLTLRRVIDPGSLTWERLGRIMETTLTAWGDIGASDSPEGEK